MSYVVITGANRGIGLEMARLFKNRGDQVVALCRKASKELKDLGVEVLENFDVTSSESVNKIARQINGKPIDILINNAGLLISDDLETLDFEGMERQFQVNALGPLRVTQAFLNNLKKGARVIMITSRMGSVADNTSGGHYGYRMSKSALNMAGVSLAHDLKAQGVAVALLHPGFVKTEMTGFQGQLEPHEAAAALLERIDSLNLDRSGQFWHSNGESLPW